MWYSGTNPVFLSVLMTTLGEWRQRSAVHSYICYWAVHFHNSWIDILGSDYLAQLITFTHVQDILMACRYIDEISASGTLYAIMGAIYQKDNARPHTVLFSQQWSQVHNVFPWPVRLRDLAPKRIFMTCWKGVINRFGIHRTRLLVASFMTESTANGRS